MKYRGLWVGSLVLSSAWVSAQECGTRVVGDGGLGFGGATAFDGDTAVIGTDVASAVNVFVRAGPAWERQATLSETGALDFGRSASIEGDTLVAGSVRAANDHGSAFVYVRSGTTWSRQAALTRPSSEAGDYVGISVGFSGDTAVVGASRANESGPESGAADVFVRSGNLWSHQAELLADDGASGDSFGIAACVARETVLVGAERAGGTGAAYVFVRAGTTWTQQAKLTADDAAPGDRFGLCVSLWDDTAVVGAMRAGPGREGAAYVFERSGTNWQQTAKLAAHDGDPFDSFGGSVWIEDESILVGAPNDGDVVPNAGSAYLYTLVAGTWTWRAKYDAEDAQPSDGFGSAVAFSSGVSLAGAPRSGSGGAAYFFPLDRSQVAYCTAKPNSAGCPPLISSFGCPSASSSSGFMVVGTQLRNQKPGFLMYGLTGRAAVPFQGGVLCVMPPLHRTPASSAGGHLPPIFDCSGVLRLDMNAFAAGKTGFVPQPELRIPGSKVDCQWYARDVADPFGSSLSGGLEYTVGI